MAEAALRGASLRAAYAAGVRQLEDADLQTPQLDSKVLLLAAAAIAQEDYIRDPEMNLSAEAEALFGVYLARRASGEPVSRILGQREFYGRTFLLNQATLDPRPDTETLIEAALSFAGEMPGPLRILDLGTGTGCILLTLVAELDGAHGLGIDRSSEALGIAEENAARLGLAGRAQFRAGDWHRGLDAQFDLIVSNPPYIPAAEIGGLMAEVRDHDPRLALDGGEDGLDAYRAILRGLEMRLKPGGRVLFEIGEGQDEAVQNLLADGGFVPAAASGIWRDLAGKPRVVAAQRGVRRSGAV